MTRVVVVGAGIAGLAAAAALAERAPTTLVERLPATGGFAGWDDRIVRDLDRQGRDAGVEQLLGTTALTWDGSRLLVAAPGSIRWIPADRLLFAGGTRPATPAELRLVGDRPAGLLSATVAEHLAGARVVLGRSLVVAGVSHWSERLAERLHARRQPVRVLGVPGQARPAWADEWLGEGDLRAVHGRPRVASVEVDRPDGTREQMACDGLVIAAPARPIRNVDGAVRPRPGLAFIAETDLAPGAEAIVAMARAAAGAIDLHEERTTA